MNTYKVEKILKGSLNLIPSPSPSLKIQIMGGKVCLRCKGKTLLGVHINKLFKIKSLFTMPSNVWPLHLKQTFPSIFWIFTEDEGDGIECRLSSYFTSAYSTTFSDPHTIRGRDRSWGNFFLVFLNELNDKNNF